MRIDLDHLRIFYEIAKLGSFTIAGRKLNISQSALSRTIQILEDRLGIKLLERHAKGVTLTPAGERFFEHACRFVEETNLLVKLITHQANVLQGDLKVITTPALGMTWLPRYIPGFLQTYPEINVSVFGETNEIDMRNADIVIRTFIPHHPHLIQRPLASFQNKLWASPEYIEQFGAPQKPEDLDHHRLITIGDHNSINPYGNNSWILNVGANPKQPRKSYVRVNFIEGLVNYAQKGLGIIEAPEEHITHWNPNLVEILPHLKGPVVEVYCIYPEQMKDSKKITAFADYLERQLGKEATG